jgi:hypothetical protein
MFNGAVRVALLEQAPYLATQSLERSKRHKPSSEALTAGLTEFTGLLDVILLS